MGFEPTIYDYVRQGEHRLYVCARSRLSVPAAHGNCLARRSIECAGKGRWCGPRRRGGRPPLVWSQAISIRYHRMQAGRTNGTTTRSRRGVLADQLDLHRLLVFRTLVNEGTMAKASARLHITQPAISTHIKTLETALGVSLFDRVGRRSVVNSVGRVLYENADRVLSVADELRTAMEELRGTSTGALDLAASFVAQYHLPRALALFTTSLPICNCPRGSRIQTTSSDWFSNAPRTSGSSPGLHR